MTNAEKFKEVFGREPNIYTCPFTTVGCNGDCEWFRASGGCYRTFWSYQYERTPTIPLSVIEDIKAEIEERSFTYFAYQTTLFAVSLEDVIEIIDRKVNEVNKE